MKLPRRCHAETLLNVSCLTEEVERGRKVLAWSPRSRYHWEQLVFGLRTHEEGWMLNRWRIKRIEAITSWRWTVHSSPSFLRLTYYNCCSWNGVLSILPKKRVMAFFPHHQIVVSRRRLVFPASSLLGTEISVTLSFWRFRFSQNYEDTLGAQWFSLIRSIRLHQSSANIWLKTGLRAWYLI